MPNEEFYKETEMGRALQPFRKPVKAITKGLTDIAGYGAGVSLIPDKFNTAKTTTEVTTPSKTTGLPDITTPFNEAKKAYNETLNRPVKTTVPPTEQYVPAPGGTTTPIGYPTEGKVYTNEDLNQPMTGGGFGYVSRGLPEAKATVEDYIRETITKMQDRGDKLALQIESGFATGRRLTAAADELRNIQTIIPTLTERLSAEAGMGARGTEAGIGKTEAEKALLEKQAAGLPSTFEQTKELAGAKVKGLEQITYEEYQKGLNKVLAGTYITPQDRKDAVDAYKAEYPQYQTDTGGAGRGLPGGEEKTFDDKFNNWWNVNSKEAEAAGWTKETAKGYFQRGK